MTTLRSQILIAAALSGALACSPASEEKAAAPAPAAPAAVAVQVTPETYIRAESDRQFGNIVMYTKARWERMLREL